MKGYDFFPQSTGYNPCIKTQDAVSLLCCQGQEILHGWGSCFMAYWDLGPLTQFLAR